MTYKPHTKAAAYTSPLREEQMVSARGHMHTVFSYKAAGIVEYHV